MAIQIRCFGNFSNMQHSTKAYDYIRKMEELTDDIILHIAGDIFVQFPEDSEEVYHMSLELMKRGLAEKIPELQLIPQEYGA